VTKIDIDKISWTIPIKNWDKISTDSYKFIYSNAKEMFEECVSESESITKKTIKLITSAVAVGAFFIAFAIKSKENGLLIIPPCIIFLMVLYSAYRLIAPKLVYPRGVEPKKVLLEDLDDSDLYKEDEKVVYVRTISIIQDCITKMDVLNALRIIRYKIFLIWFALFIISVAVFVGASIYHL
jgi:hypothetical protein